MTASYSYSLGDWADNAVLNEWRFDYGVLTLHDASM